MKKKTHHNPIIYLYHKIKNTRKRGEKVVLLLKICWIRARISDLLAKVWKIIEKFFGVTNVLYTFSETPKCLLYPKNGYGVEICIGIHSYFRPWCIRESNRRLLYLQRLQGILQWFDILSTTNIYKKFERIRVSWYAKIETWKWV